MTIEKILRQPEGKTLEFKRDLSSPKKLMTTLVAFANTSGGRVIIGVDDKTRKAIGISAPLDEEEKLCNLIADMKQGVSKIRNPVIARVFRELELIEQWGSGIRRIFDEAAELNLPAPEIVEIGMRVRFIVRLAKAIPTHISESGPESRPESRPESQLESNLAARVLMRLASKEEGKAGLAKMLGHKTVSGELKLQLKRLSEKELIEFTIPEKPNSRLQKYRLTAKGKALIKEAVAEQ